MAYLLSSEMEILSINTLGSTYNFNFTIILSIKYLNPKFVLNFLYLSIVRLSVFSLLR